jgi:S-DNA-T family DNA segregation ATPase FtsK/SpoIIIE
MEVLTMFLKFDPYYKKTQACFRYAGLSRQTMIGKTHYEIMPRVQNVQHKIGETIVTFTLPNGMDPKNIKKCEYVFRQMFGDNTVVVGDLKAFSVHVFHNKMPVSVKYKPTEIKVASNGLALPIIVGVGATGALTIYDMRKYPHLLIAGETGFGKSTELRAILTTLMLYRPTVRFILADLKRSEFHVFRRCAPVDDLCTTADHLALALDNVRKELDRRGKLLDERGLTNTAETDLPDIVVAIDEVALLKKEKKIMETIEDISAIGRALGVYLILSMQRPDAQVLDGKLKNNLTVRLSYKQADKINSKIVLGENGAEKLTHPGRGLLKITNTQVMQSPYLEAAQAKALLDPLRTRAENKTSEPVPEQESGQLFDVLEDDDDA